MPYLSNGAASPVFSLDASQFFFFIQMNAVVAVVNGPLHWVTSS
jgi:hypothetical protein